MPAERPLLKPMMKLQGRASSVQPKRCANKTVAPPATASVEPSARRRAGCIAARGAVAAQVRKMSLLFSARLARVGPLGPRRAYGTFYQ